MIDPSKLIICPYCRHPAIQVKGDSIYPHATHLHNKFFFLCRPCDAYVGCHPGSTVPLGRLANSELRAIRQKAHLALDPLWRQQGIKRSDAYQWLSDRLQMPVVKCHIGNFDVEMCKEVIKICKKGLKP